MRNTQKMLGDGSQPKRESPTMMDGRATTSGNADASLCRDASLESMSGPDREEAFRLVVELRERQPARK